MYKVTKRDCPMFGIGPYVCEFICDTASDITTLPTSISEGTGGRTVYDNQKCASGSIAIVASGSDSKQYMLNNQDIWCPYSVAAGSSSGGSGESSVTVDFALSETSENPVANKTITAALNDKADTTHTHTANEVGADASGSAASALQEAKAYTDSEIADAMAENQTVVETLNTAIGTKANKTDIPTKVSQLENDSGYLTEHQNLSEYAKTTDVPNIKVNAAVNADTIATVPINDIFISKTLQGISDIDNTDGNWSVGIVTVWEGVSGTFPDNCPDWVVINQHRSSGDHFVMQTCTSIEANPKMWVRGKHVSAEIWANWQRVNDGGNADTLDGMHADSFRHITKNTLNSLPSQPTGEGDYFVIDSAGTDFPYTWGYMSIRYGSSNNEFVATFQSTGNDNKMYINTHRGGWVGWKEVYTSGNKPYVAGEITFANQVGDDYTNSPVSTNHGFMPSKVLYWELPGDYMKYPYQVYSATSFDENSFTPYVRYGHMSAEGASTPAPSYKYGYIIFK